MIKLYSATSCSSSRKAKEWLKQQKLEFEEINISNDSIHFNEFLKILSLTEEGTEEIISKRSRAYDTFRDVIEHLSVKKLIELIDENRTLLRRPLIVDDQRLQVGFNEDDIRKFLPRKMRRVELRDAIENVRRHDLERAKFEPVAN